jgi:hypothetical protein
MLLVDGEWGAGLPANNLAETFSSGEPGTVQLIRFLPYLDQ